MDEMMEEDARMCACEGGKIAIENFHFLGEKENSYHRSRQKDELLPELDITWSQMRLCYFVEATENCRSMCISNIACCTPYIRADTAIHVLPYLVRYSTSTYGYVYIYVLPYFLVEALYVSSGGCTAVRGTYSK